MFGFDLIIALLYIPMHNGSIIHLNSYLNESLMNKEDIDALQSVKTRSI